MRLLLRTRLCLVASWLLSCPAALGEAAPILISAPEPDLSCDPCLERPSLRVRAITHGSPDVLFWKQIEKAAVQAARDMRVRFAFEFYENDHEAMARAILQASTEADALIVSVPSPVVRDAVRRAVLEAGMPVFGMNSGYDANEDSGVLTFVAMDEYLGGQQAAQTFLKELDGRYNISRSDGLLQDDDRELAAISVFEEEADQINATNYTNATLPQDPPIVPHNISAVFVNHAPGNTALDRRYQGLYDELAKAYPYYDSRDNVQHLRLDGNEDSLQVLQKVFGSCPDLVLVAGASAMETTLQALDRNGCSSSSEGTLVGVFDTSFNVYSAIVQKKVLFAVNQQQYLQGALPVILAATFLTTGERLAPSSENPFGIYSSGPRIVALENIPTDQEQICETQAYPVCRPGEEPLQDMGYEYCPCARRSDVTIAAVTHFNTGGNFGRAWIANMEQAAVDAGIDFRNEYFKKQSNPHHLYTQMASQIIAHCQAGVRVIIISVLGQDLMPAIQECLDLRIPVVVKNGGPWRDIPSPGAEFHVGYNGEMYAAIAREFMARAPDVKQLVCARHDSPITKTRCEVFGAAIAETNGAVEYLGDVSFSPAGCEDCYAVALAEFFSGVAADNPTLRGVGVLNIPPKMNNKTLELQAAHPDLLVAGTGSNAFANQALATGNLLFSSDAGGFMQGYLPIWLATILATTGMQLANLEIETGPVFNTRPMSQAKAACQKAFYPVCPPPIDYKLNQLTNVRPVGHTLVALVYATALGFCSWMLYYRHHSVVARSQPVFLLMISFGAVLMVTAIIPLGVDDSVASIDTAGRACMAIPWCAALGFTIMFAGIFCKIWRINRLMTAAKKFRREQVKPWHVIAPLVALSVGNVVFLAVWTGVDPMFFSREELCGSEDHSSVGTCKLGETPVSKTMFALIAVINVVALLLANVQAYQARWVSDDLSESRYIFINMVGMLQVGIMGIPLVTLLSEDPIALYFLLSVILFLISESTLLLMFVPKIISFREERLSKKRDNNRTTGVTGMSNSSWLSPGSARSVGSRPSGYGFDSTKSLRPSIPGSFALQPSNNASPSITTNAKRKSSMAPASSATLDSDAIPRSKLVVLEKLLREEAGVNTKILFAQAGLEGLAKGELSARLATAVIETCDGDLDKITQMKRALDLGDDDDIASDLEL